MRSGISFQKSGLCSVHFSLKSTGSSTFFSVLKYFLVKVDINVAISSELSLFEEIFNVFIVSSNSSSR